MANDRTLTAADVVLTLSVARLYPVPRRITGFSSDDVTGSDAVTPAETQMGVDGRLSAGWAAAPTSQTITLQADSESNDFFENWAGAERQAKGKYVASGLLIIPATGRKYTLNRGFLMTTNPFPTARRILQPRAYIIQWESVTVAADPSTLLGGVLAGLL